MNIDFTDNCQIFPVMSFLVRDAREFASMRRYEESGGKKETIKQLICQATALVFWEDTLVKTVVFISEHFMLYSLFIK